MFKDAASLPFYVVTLTNNNNKEQVDKRIRKKTPNNTKENSTGTKHKWKTRVTTRKKGSEPKCSESESFKHIKINM
jgi:hypothetical protein